MLKKNWFVLILLFTCIHTPSFAVKQKKIQFIDVKITLDNLSNTHNSSYTNNQQSNISNFNEEPTIEFDDETNFNEETDIIDIEIEDDNSVPDDLLSYSYTLLSPFIYNYNDYNNPNKPLLQQARDLLNTIINIPNSNELTRITSYYKLNSHYAVELFLKNLDQFLEKTYYRLMKIKKLICIKEQTISTYRSCIFNQKNNLNVQEKRQLVTIARLQLDYCMLLLFPENLITPYESLKNKILVLEPGEAIL